MFAFETSKDCHWDQLDQKIHMQISQKAFYLFIVLTIFSYLLFGKSSFILSFIPLIVLVLLLLYTLINRNTNGFFKAASIISCTGIAWFRYYFIGEETILYNQFQVMIMPLPLFLFTGSYTITSVSFLYVLAFTAFNVGQIRHQFQNSPVYFQKNLYYFLDNIYPLCFAILVFLSLIVFQKRLLLSQLWARQKEKEDLLLEVQAKNQELKRLYKDKAKLLLGLSHEFRNPINAALGNLELANEKILDPVVQKYLVNCKVSIEMLYHLVSNLLDSTKLEAGILELNPVRKDAIAMFQKVWGIVRNLFDKHGLVGEFYIHRKIPRMLNIDSHFAVKILLNLILNAIKYTHEGAVMTVVSWIDGEKPLEDLLLPSSSFYSKFLASFIKKKVNNDNALSLKKYQRQISGSNVQYLDPDQDTDVPYEPSPQLNQLLRSHTFMQKNSLNDINDFQNIANNYYKLTNSSDTEAFSLEKGAPQRGGTAQRKGFLKIEVFDSGCGIEFEEDKDSIFKKNSSYSGQTGNRLSLGLGLWLTKSLSEIMGGQVKAFSERDIGSQFIAVIPAESSYLQSEEHIERVSTEEERNAVELKALVVDDDRYNREINSIFLSKAGVKIKAEAFNGEEAVRIFTSKPANYFDLVVMDLEMPIMNGKEAVRRIRAHEKKSGVGSPVKVVIATGNCDLAEYSECMDKTGDIRADFFYRKPLMRKDVEELVDLLRREKVQPRSLCVVVGGDLLTVELIENFVRTQGVHVVAVNSVGKAESLMREWRGSVRWAFVNLSAKRESCGQFVYNLRRANPKVEVVGLCESKSTYRSLEIQKFLNFPLSKEDIAEVFEPM